MHDYYKCDEYQTCAQDHLGADLESSTIVLVEPHHTSIAIAAFGNLSGLDIEGGTMIKRKIEDHDAAKVRESRGKAHRGGKRLVDVQKS